MLTPLRKYTELSAPLRSDDDPDVPSSMQVVFEAAETPKIMNIVRTEIVGARCNQYGRLLGDYRLSRLPPRDARSRSQGEVVSRLVDVATLGPNSLRRDASAWSLGSSLEPRQCYIQPR